MSRDLDKKIAEIKGWKEIDEPHNFGFKPVYLWPDGTTRTYGLPYFSEYIEHAWTLFEEAKNSMFLKRNRFLEILSDLLQSNELLPKNNKIAWPHAILFLTPENICKAYIKWKENSSPKASEPEDITS